MSVLIAGAGLAGSEAAWQLLRRGVAVELIDIKPIAFTPAHHSEDFAELVCSNSLRAEGVLNAVGLLKEEMRRLGSLVMEAADATRVPAGGALAVDREAFSRFITERLMGHRLLRYESRELTALPDDRLAIIATGPLTTGALSAAITEAFGTAQLSFFDAAAPIVEADSIDRERVFFQSRYDKGEADYINCPMDRGQYDAFYQALLLAETAELHGFEQGQVFEGCLPIEVLAGRGYDTMRFGPLKPVGLVNPATGQTPYAVVQLRQDDAAKTLYNLVGFQTRLKFGEQKRVFSMIPGLERARFARYGIMHRNTYLNSPALLTNTYCSKNRPNLYFAGQLSGVEGYVESAASGLLCGIHAAQRYLGKKPEPFPPETAMGALAHYVATPGRRDFQPMNVNFGILAPLTLKASGRKDRNTKLAERALHIVDRLAKNL